MSGDSLRRWWRHIHPGDNPLVRRWDRTEARVVLLHLPTAAVLLENAPPASRAVRGIHINNTTHVWARWQLPSGAIREGWVNAPFDAQAGSEVEIWLDNNGQRVSRPLSHEEATAIGVGIAANLWVASVSVLALTFWAVRAKLNTARYTAWDRE